MAESLNRQAGFTLIEALVAMVILAVALGVLFGQLGEGLRLVGDGDEVHRQTALAQSLLDRLPTEQPLRDGISSGDTVDGLHWRLKVEPYGSATDQASWPVAPRHVVVSVGCAGDDEAKAVSLTTLWLVPKATP